MSKNHALSRISSQVEESMAVKAEFFKRSSESLVQAAEIMGQSLKKGGKVLVCGNGGSAADAQHFAGEMIGRFLKERAAIAAVALTTDTSVMTAIGNDYGYEFVFSRQVDGLGKPEDVFLAISTSGNSKNVIRAIESARRIGMKVVGLTGGSGGAMAKLCDIHLNVSLGKNSPRIQETHLMCVHLLVDLIDEFFS